VDLLHLPDGSTKISSREPDSFFNKPSGVENFQDKNRQPNKIVIANPVPRTNERKTLPPAQPMPISESKLSPPPISIVTNLTGSTIRGANTVFQSQVNYAHGIITEIENSTSLILIQIVKTLIDDWQNEVDRIHKKHLEAKTLINQAIGVMAAGNQGAATVALDKACQADNTDKANAEAEFLNGVQIGLMDRSYKTAKYRFAACLRHIPNDAAALNNLAIAEIMTDDHASAINHFRAAIATSGGNPAIVHNLVKVLTEANRKNLRVTPSAVAAYSALLDQCQAQEQQNSSSWLYLFPANDDQEDFDYQLLKQNDKLTVDSSNLPRWIEDRVCMVCEGRGRVPCPDCQNGTIGSTKRVLMYRDAGTGVEVYQDKKIRIPCNTCNGAGQLECRNCNGNGTDH
jgi:hypothetical protein